MSWKKIAVSWSPLSYMMKNDYPISILTKIYSPYPSPSVMNIIFWGLISILRIWKRCKKKLNWLQMVNMYLKVQSQQNWHVRPCTCAWVGRIWWNSDCIMYIWARNVCTVWTRKIHRNQNYNKSLIDQKGLPRPGEVKFRGSLRGYFLPINCCIKQFGF